MRKLLIAAAGATTDARYARLGALAHDILDFTHDVARGRSA